MKQYKKVKDKIFETEAVEVEVDVKSIESRIETLNQAIESVTKQLGKLQNRNNTYEIEKAELEEEFKKINKLK